MICSGGESIKAFTASSSKDSCVVRAIVIHSASVREDNCSTWSGVRTNGKVGREGSGLGTTMLEGGSEEEEDCLAAFDFFLFWELDTTGVYPSVSMDESVLMVGSETGESLSAVICGAATGEKEEARRSVTVLPVPVAGDLEVEEERLFDFFGVGRLGQDRES